MLHTTLWSYVINGMHSSHPNLFYGIICAGKFICPIFLSLLISRWFDIHRRMKFCAISVNVTIAVGYILYIIPISPFFAFAGTTLQGSCFILTALMNSEILRVYDNDEIQGKFLMVMFAYGLGETIGPVCVKLLDKVDFWIGGLHIMYGNVPSLVLPWPT